MTNDILCGNEMHKHVRCDISSSCVEKLQASEDSTPRLVPDLYYFKFLNVLCFKRNLTTPVIRRGHSCENERHFICTEKY